MGYKNASVASNTIQNATVTTTAETVAFTSPGVNQPADNALVLVFWEVVITVGTNGTSITPRLRRGTTTAGTLINVASALTVAAGNNVKLSGVYQDLPGVVAAQQYSLTVVVGAATGNSTILDGSIAILVP